MSAQIEVICDMDYETIDGVTISAEKKVSMPCVPPIGSVIVFDEGEGRIAQLEVGLIYFLQNDGGFIVEVRPTRDVELDEKWSMAVVERLESGGWEIWQVEDWGGGVVEDGFFHRTAQRRART